MDRKAIRIEAAKALEKLVLNRGVGLALARAFRNEDGFYNEASREYAEIVRAYWMFPKRLVVVGGKDGVVPAGGAME